MSHQNGSRRMFRGRAGPTDSNLPKYSARRRKQTQSKHSAAPPNDDTSSDFVATPNNEIDPGGKALVFSDLDTGIVLQTPDRYVDEIESKQETVNEPVEEDSAALKEVKHLHSRIKNNQKSISQSSCLSNPIAYETNVLNATKNCVVEWEAILKRHDDLPVPLLRSTGQALFELLQHSLQSGPLKGAKPGYFKRCGSEIAAKVASFLRSVCPTAEASRALHFTETQVQAIQRWIDNAEISAKSQTPPSKSMMKRESMAKKKSASKRR